MPSTLLVGLRNVFFFPSQVDRLIWTSHLSLILSSADGASRTAFTLFKTLDTEPLQPCHIGVAWDGGSLHLVFSISLGKRFVFAVSDPACRVLVSGHSYQVLAGARVCWHLIDLLQV